VTIYGVGYRSLQYRSESAVARLAAVAALEFRTLFRSRWGVALFAICLLPSLVQLVFLMMHAGVLQFGPRGWVHGLQEQLAGNPGLARWIPTRLRFYLAPILEWSLAPVLMLTVLVSSRAIAKDRAANALELFWTRGISPRGYFVAKWLGSLALLGLLCVGAPLVLWILGVVMAPDWGFLEQTWPFMPRALLGLAVFTVALSYLPVVFSAVAGSPNLASVSWCMLLLGSLAFGNVLSALLRDVAWEPVLSLWDAAATLARWIAGMPEREATVRGAFVNLTVVSAALSALAIRRLRVREAVG
jgi:ABC-type transport system involved in multi-copper enzyme maturation permease subunit